MKTVDIHHAEAHLAELVEQAAKGEPFVIAKAGRPLVKVVAADEPERPMVRRRGFLEGQLSVPDDFDTMFAKEIEEMFYGETPCSSSDPA
jgi:prevent-host-death family protein